jgi:amidophosphoribosyltransferase
MRQLYGHMAVGHTRYSTTGASVLTNTQPFVIETMHGPIAMAHNGQVRFTYFIDGDAVI